MHRHKWSKWVEVETSFIVISGPAAGKAYGNIAAQERSCEKCGLKKRRDL